MKARNLNNTAKAEQETLIFNRLEKVGSQSLMTLIAQLSRVRNFTAYVKEEKAITRSTYPPYEEEAIAEEITDVPVAMSYVEHFNWLNFSRYDLPKPIYINLVRHPIQKVISAYYYIRHPAVYGWYLQRGNRKLEPKEYFDTSFNDCVKQAKIPDCQFEPNVRNFQDWRRFSLYFCGNDPVCE